MTSQIENTSRTPELPIVRSDLAFDNGAISRFNAWFFTAFAQYINYMARLHKQSAFSELESGAVLEIGAGTGANFGYLPRGTQLYAVEPNLRMHAKLRERAAAAGVPLTVLVTGAEAIALPDESVDEVICSLVLCTVPDPDRVLAEVRRVLRPGGKFRFAEHVAADPGSVRYRIQRALRRPWGYVFEGCNPARNTPETVASAGFRTLLVERRKLRHSVFYPVNTAAWGIAVK